jgi:hypothetical protein
VEKGMIRETEGVLRERVRNKRTRTVNGTPQPVNLIPKQHQSRRWMSIHLSFLDLEKSVKMGT